MNENSLKNSCWWKEISNNEYYKDNEIVQYFIENLNGNKQVYMNIRNTEYFKELKKLGDEEYKRINKFIQFIKERIITKELRKLKKHTPLSFKPENILSSDEKPKEYIEQIFFDYNKDILCVKYKSNPDRLEYFSFENKRDHSFDLEFGRSLEDIRKRIINHLQNRMNVYLQQIKWGHDFTLSRFVNNNVKEITKQYNEEYNTSFEEVYAINVFPGFTFICRKNKKIELATYYIVAYDKTKQYLHIFFDNKDIFLEKLYPYKEYIDMFNNYNDFDMKDLHLVLDKRIKTRGNYFTIIDSSGATLTYKKINEEIKELSNEEINKELLYLI